MTIWLASRPGATGNPAILVYSTRMAPTERPDIGYAMIFPSMTIVKVIAVQIVGLLVAAGAAAERRNGVMAAPSRTGRCAGAWDAMKSNHLKIRPVSPQLVTFDAIMPATMAVRAEESGVKRALSIR